MGGLRKGGADLAGGGGAVHRPDERAPSSVVPAASAVCEVDIAPPAKEEAVGERMVVGIGGFRWDDFFDCRVGDMSLLVWGKPDRRQGFGGQHAAEGCDVGRLGALSRSLQLVLAQALIVLLVALPRTAGGGATKRKHTTVASRLGTLAIAAFHGVSNVPAAGGATAAFIWAFRNFRSRIACEI